MTQLELVFGPPPGAWRDEPASWSRNLPDLSGVNQFAIVLRQPDDPPMLSRKERAKLFPNGNASDHWRAWLKRPARWWAAQWLRLLRRQGESMTFHGLVVTLSDGSYGADTAFAAPPEEGLWLAVERGSIWWANTSGGVRFAPRPARCGAPCCARPS